ncbi:MAG: response regulator transcription factor [Clostridiales bacterium]|nr:response regulator transcription factor [Clostridiales bacterium]
MICLAVFEPDAGRKAIIKDLLVRYTVQQNCEMELLWFVDNDPIPKIEKHAERIQIALVSLDYGKGIESGQLLYKQNPDCRILYYQDSKCDLEPLLSTRPIGFCLWERCGETFLEKLDHAYNDVLMIQTTFRYETKSKMYLLPKRNILYFQSDLRYVDICTIQGDHPRILAKLSEIELLAGSVFVRIHKSYLVNVKHILWIDKKKHLILLTNGEQLPVSDAQYEQVCERLRVLK